MKLLRTKLFALTVCSALMLPTVTGAATAVEPAKPSAVIAYPSFQFQSIAQSIINGITVPGIYVTNEDSRVAYIPGSVGLVVVDIGTALPPGSYYVK
jgi:hypothetical protein